jgi:hypothetical protein
MKIPKIFFLIKKNLMRRKRINLKKEKFYEKKFLEFQPFPKCENKANNKFTRKMEFGSKQKKKEDSFEFKRMLFLKKRVKYFILIPRQNVYPDIFIHRYNEKTEKYHKLQNFNFEYDTSNRNKTIEICFDLNKVKIDKKKRRSSYYYYGKYRLVLYFHKNDEEEDEEDDEEYDKYKKYEKSYHTFLRCYSTSFGIMPRGGENILEDTN